MHYANPECAFPAYAGEYKPHSAILCRLFRVPFVRFTRRIKTTALNRTNGPCAVARPRQRGLSLLNTQYIHIYIFIRKKGCFAPAERYMEGERPPVYVWGVFVQFYFPALFPCVRRKGD